MRKRLIPALLVCLVLLSACGGVPDVDAADIARGAAVYTDGGGGTAFSVSEYDLLPGADGGGRVFRTLGRMGRDELAARGYTDGQIETLRDYGGGALADAPELREASAQLTGSVTCVAATDTEITAELVSCVLTVAPALPGTEELARGAAADTECLREGRL